jgi:hypothetical protein
MEAAQINVFMVFILLAGRSTARVSLLPCFADKERDRTAMRKPRGNLKQAWSKP